MKKYQDPDPLHGNGKAVPKPKSKTLNGRLVYRYYTSWSPKGVLPRFDDQFVVKARKNDGRNRNILPFRRCAK